MRTKQRSAASADGITIKLISLQVAWYAFASLKVNKWLGTMAASVSELHACISKSKAALFCSALCSCERWSGWNVCCVLSGVGWMMDFKPFSVENPFTEKNAFTFPR